MKKLQVFVVILLASTRTSAWQDHSSENDLIEDLLPGRSCYYQPYNKCLTCNCHTTGTSAKLNFLLGYNVSKQGSDIREVKIQNCKDLFVQLDLRGVDATNVPINFRSIQKVTFEKVIFEPRYSDAQQLELSFYNVEKVVMEGLNVRDTLKIRAHNVKEVIIQNSTFAHIPPRGVSVSMAKIVDIRDSLFTRISRKSIVIETTKYVYVTNNEMTINAFEVIFAKDGSELILSCNRMIGQRVSPECDVTTTTPTTTTTTTTTNRPFFNTDKRTVNSETLPETLDGKSTSIAADDDSNMAEIIGGVVGGLLVIIIVLLIILLLKKDKTVDNDQEVKSIEEQPMTLKDDNQDEKKESNDEKSSLLNHDADDDEEEEEQKVKFASPVWLAEIQNNKIFNRQKSLLSEDNLVDLAKSGKSPDKEQVILEDDQNSYQKAELAGSDKQSNSIDSSHCGDVEVNVNKVAAADVDNELVA